jgi:hypothetical protein
MQDEYDKKVKALEDAWEARLANVKSAAKEAYEEGLVQAEELGRAKGVVEGKASAIEDDVREYKEGVEKRVEDARASGEAVGELKGAKTGGAAAASAGKG